MREFTTPDGVAWSAWETRPTQTSNRVSPLPAGFADGWLCFESGPERRRLAPVPPGWRDCSEAELLSLWERASPVRSRLRPATGPAE